MQTSLLRVIEDHAVTRVGGERVIPVNVRLIVAAQSDLAEKVRRKEFREDLWYRLAVFPIILQPLRNRKLDIPVLIKYFLQIECDKLHLEYLPSIPEDEMTKIMEYDWPGNIRELRSVIERSLIIHSAGNSHAPLHFDFLSGIASLECIRDTKTDIMEGWPTLENLTNRYIRKVLSKTGGKLKGPNSATEILGIHYTTLRKHMLQLGIPLPRSHNRTEKYQAPKEVSRKQKRFV